MAKFEVFKEQDETKPPVLLALRRQGTDIDLVVVDPQGRALWTIVGITERGTLRIYNGVPAEVGFQVDLCDRIVKED